MGNVCGHHKRLKWNERQIIQSWVPLLVDLFTYDSTGNISGLNATHFTQDYHAANDQLRTLPILLRGRSGINKQLLRKIKSLQHQTSTLIPNNLHQQPQQPLPQQSNNNLDTSFHPSSSTVTQRNVPLEESQ
jgi:hypothetical protein